MIEIVDRKELQASIEEYCQIYHNKDSPEFGFILARKFLRFINLRDVVLGDESVEFEEFHYFFVSPSGHGYLRIVLRHISREFYKALCINDEKYRSEVSVLSEGSKMLLAAISGYVAAKVNIETAIISAMGSALLILISKLGVNAFCEYCSENMYDWFPEEHNSQC